MNRSKSPTVLFPRYKPDDYLRPRSYYMGLLRKDSDYIIFGEQHLTYAICIFKSFKYKELSGVMIDLLLVDRDYRGKGYGKLLLRALIDKYPHTTISLSVASENKNAIGLYEKMGFVAETPIPSKAGIIYMTRPVY